MPYTLFSVGERFNSYQNGPLEFLFSSAIRDFNLVLTKQSGPFPNTWETTVLSPGHYMVAFDAAGQEIGRVDFDAGGLISEKTLAVRGIRKVLVYPFNLHFDAQWNSWVGESVGHRVSFAPDCPPVGDPLIDHPDLTLGMIL